MFTVKHIKNEGHEHLYSTDQVVTFTKRDAERKASVSFTENQHLVVLEEGRVFVMNAGGSTVSSYDLTHLNSAQTDFFRNASAPRDH